jgi:hypothetical protein
MPEPIRNPRRVSSVPLPSRKPASSLKTASPSTPTVGGPPLPKRSPAREVSVRRPLSNNKSPSFGGIDFSLVDKILKNFKEEKIEEQNEPLDYARSAVDFYRQNFSASQAAINYANKINKKMENAKSILSKYNITTGDIVKGLIHTTPSDLEAKPLHPQSDIPTPEKNPQRNPPLPERPASKLSVTKEPSSLNTTTPASPKSKSKTADLIRKKWDFSKGFPERKW